MISQKTSSYIISIFLTPTLFVLEEQRVKQLRGSLEDSVRLHVSSGPGMASWTHLTEVPQGVKRKFFTLRSSVAELGFRRSPLLGENGEHLWEQMLAWATQVSKNRVSTLKFPSQICLGMTKEKEGERNGPDPYGFLTGYLQLLQRTVSYHYKRSHDSPLGSKSWLALIDQKAT